MCTFQMIFIKVSGNVQMLPALFGNLTGLETCPKGTEDQSFMDGGRWQRYTEDIEPIFSSIQEDMHRE